MLILTMLILTLFVSCALFPLVISVTVTTKYGNLEGFTASYPNVPGSLQFNTVNKFLGVPYAAPPIGENRLRAPRPLNGWKNVRPAKMHGNACMQPSFYALYFNRYDHNISYSEDCLYLDVYTSSVNLSLPVMIYIHGGAYEGGTSITFPSDILVLHGVVVVVIQYRLGPFGFFTTGNSAAPGNYGMLDQVEALKWVKDNIENFGGNPNMVTIFGESAGGSSVSLHLMSPLSKDLFHRAIAESGVDLCPWATQPVSYGLRFAKELAQKLDCTSSDHNVMVNCIRKMKDTDIQKASDEIALQFYEYFRWSPVVDKNFLPDTPRNLRQTRKFEELPLMISFNSHEGATFIPLLASGLFGEMAESVDNGAKPAYFKDFITKLAHARNSRKEVADLISDALEFMYTPWPDNNDRYSLRSQLVDLISDYLFFAPAHEVADIHSEVAPVYMYEFARRPSNASLSPAEWMGVIHFDNAPFDFGIPLLPSLPSRYDAADKNVSLFVMEMYANFAKFGEPTPQPVSGVTWKRYNSSHRAYLRIDVNPKADASFYSRRMAFWNDYYPKLAQFKLDTKIHVVSGANTGVAMGIFAEILLTTILAIFGIILTSHFNWSPFVRMF